MKAPAINIMERLAVVLLVLAFMIAAWPKAERDSSQVGRVNEAGRKFEFGKPNHNSDAVKRGIVAGHRVTPQGMEVGIDIDAKTVHGVTAIKVVGQALPAKARKLAYAIKVCDDHTNKEIASSVFGANEEHTPGILANIEKGDFFDLKPGKYRIYAYVFDMLDRGRKSDQIKLTDRNLMMISKVHVVE